GGGGAYAAWVRAVRAWSREEPADLAALPRLGGEEFNVATWERLAVHVVSAVDTRFAQWADRLSRACEPAEDEFSFGRELAQARAGLQAIRALVRHPGLPDQISVQLAETVDQHICSLQREMELSHVQQGRSDSDPQWVELRLQTMRDNAFTSVLVAPPEPSAGASGRLARSRRTPRGPRPASDQEPNENVCRDMQPSAPAEGDLPSAGDPWAAGTATASRRCVVPD
ncbi:hypothetical protein, partial [Streptomyces buecherae]|uniref:hypothetical protein n=1 Tax=Streptomyces buecherae TaxID=2763006 RepID=UPI001C9A4C63